MDIAFAVSTSLPVHGARTVAQVCTSSSGRPSFRTSRNSHAAVRMIGKAPEANASSELLSSVDGNEVQVLNDELNMIPEGEEELDTSNIETLEMPLPIINAENVKVARMKFRLHEHDTGSPEYQIATLTTRITYLTEHLKKNRKDHASTRGLLRMVANRRKLLKFVKRKDPKRFDYLVTALNIRVSATLRSV